jgi:8-amino-7-oxononanoate synthase
MRHEEWIEGEMAALRARGLERRARVLPDAERRQRGDGRRYLNLSSNDYLDLARNPAVAEAAVRLLRQDGSGATASRLMAGTLPCHEELERRLADFKGYPAALLFGSGYLANLGSIPALAGREDRVFADKLVHASIVDGMVLSRATFNRFQHNDPEHLDSMLRKRPASDRCLVITESVFSMDGDLAPLDELCRVAHRRGAMVMVDEAHATGIFGPEGSGRVRQLRLEQSVNVCMATLSKALGGSGGFVACSAAMRELLVNKARTFVFTTALPPAVVGSALGALEALGKSPDMGASLLERSSFFRDRLRAAGLNTGASASQIIPVIIGDAARAVDMSRRLAERGILAVAVRPPTVPVGTARLRLSVTLAHSREDLSRAADEIVGCAREAGVL